MKITRRNDHFIITQKDVSPYLDGCEVIGVFNPAAAFYQNEIILLLRVAERPIQKSDDILTVIFYDTKTNCIKTLDLAKNDSQYDFTDKREVRDNNKKDGSFCFLTSISYLRIARSRDGIHFKVDEKPFLFPSNEYETFGIEDSRITQIGDNYYIYFTSVSYHGICEELVSTTDFHHITYLGIIFLPENKDVVILPEKINGKYYALNRPVPKATGDPSIWISESDNLIYWGNHKYLMGLRPHNWDSVRIGPGAIPFKTSKGWLEIYHGADSRNRYCLGAVMLDKNDPTEIVARSDEPILEPQKLESKNEFLKNVVFTCGALCKENIIHLYYGVSDSAVAYTEIKLSDVLTILS
jgi:predicted GH43/DUF377 family glycosyl hydrolase